MDNNLRIYELLPEGARPERLNAYPWRWHKRDDISWRDGRTDDQISQMNALAILRDAAMDLIPQYFIRIEYDDGQHYARDERDNGWRGPHRNTRTEAIIDALERISEQENRNG